MKTSSAKAKGRKLQNLVRDKLRKAFEFLEPDDIKSQVMGMTGEDIVLSPAARQHIPFSFECKNVERLNFWECIKQTEANRKDCTAPALVIKKNRREPYVAIPLDIFIDIIEHLHYLEGYNYENIRDL